MLENDCAWNSNEERLLCHMLLRDELAARLKLTSEGTTFWRAFIVQNRKSGEVYAKMRFRHKKDKASWSRIHPIDQSNAQKTVQYLQSNLEEVLTTALELMHPEIGSAEVRSAVVSFFPPPDDGDGSKTIDWLIAQDLIQIKEVIPVHRTERQQ